MLKKVFGIVVLACLLPALAHAASWTLNTWVKSGGGTISVRGGTPQTSANGSVFKTYTTSSSFNVEVTPNTGYSISQVNHNNVVIPSPTLTSYSVHGPGSQNVHATFKPDPLTVQAFASAGGSVNITKINGIYYNSTLATARKITFTPQRGFKVNSIVGAPDDAAISSALPAAFNAPVTITIPANFVFTSSITITGNFSGPAVAKAGPPQLVTKGTPTTLDGSASTGSTSGREYTYAWSQQSGPTTVTLISANSAKPTFTPSVSGTYIFALTVDGSTANTTVTVTDDNTGVAAAVQTQCQNCHAANGIGTAPNVNVFGKWSSSKHLKNNVSNIICSQCHIGANTGGHPGIVNTNVCINCHTATLGTSLAVSAGHNGITNTNTSTCISCHNPHDLTASGAALTCSSCHTDPPVAGQYYTGTVKYTHAAGSTCSNCHAVPPTTDATTTHRDGKIEILTNDIACAACHTSYPPASHVTYGAVGGTTPNCSTCHTFTGFNGATHNDGMLNVASASCTTCHGNPPQVLTVARSGHTGQHLNVSNCDMCHGIGAGTNANHKNGTVDVLKSGAPHFNNVTSGMYPAAYVTSTSTCANCHNNNANNQTIRTQWAASGHANTTALPWIDYDFKFGAHGDPTCVRCHTTTGFIAYSTAKVTAAWGTASDKTKEVLTCVGCHKDVANGIVRTVTPNKPFADEATFTNVDVGTSNICMDCHSGRNNGSSIQKLVVTGTDDLTNTGYVAPHYLTAGGSLQGKSGFHFPDRSYTAYADNAHSKVGSANSNNTGSDGPCVACHMSATEKHKFSAVTVTNGSVAAITTTACANCHTDSSKFNASALDAKKVAFTNALAVLKAALADKNIVVTDNYPYVANVNWGAGQNGANLMGAAFNYKLFAAEPGAYTHNPEYAKQLIADSIEAVATGGTVTGSDVSTYVNSLVGKGVTADQISSFNTFTNATSSCASCHNFPPATSSHATATTSPLSCSNCHTFTGMGGTTHNNGTVDLNLTCTSCHGNPPTALTVAISGNTGTHTTATDCATCHGANPGAAGHNNGTLSTTCVACHGNPPTALTVALSGHTGTHTTATDCASCHGANPGTPGHNNGTLSTTCVACHGNPPTTLTVALSGHTGTHTTATDCATCHGANPGAAGHNNGTLSTTCVACHGNPPTALTVAISGHTGTHTTATDCATCHGANPGATGHNNGTLQVSMTCNSCHGYDAASWATAPSIYPEGKGAHAKHVAYLVANAGNGFALNPTTDQYGSGASWTNVCAVCHTGATHKANGVEVSIRNDFQFGADAPTFNGTPGTSSAVAGKEKTCSNISCHYFTSPIWSNY